MSGVNGWAAAQTLLGFGRCTPGLCLYYVWQSYKANGAVTDHPAVGTATEAWYASEGKHPGDRNPPVGVPVFWGPKSSSYAGDVTISLGNGNIAATDWPYNGVVGLTTIDARERQIGRPYLGWAEAIFDQPIEGTSLAATTSTAFTTIDKIKEQIMAGNPIYVNAIAGSRAILSLDLDAPFIIRTEEEAIAASKLFEGVDVANEHEMNVAKNLFQGLRDEIVKADKKLRGAVAPVEPVKPPVVTPPKG